MGGNHDVVSPLPLQSAPCARRFTMDLAIAHHIQGKAMADINSTGRVQLHRSVYASRDRRGSSSDRQQPKPPPASTDALSSETAAPPDAATPAAQPDPDATVGRHLNLLG